MTIGIRIRRNFTSRAIRNYGNFPAMLEMMIKLVRDRA